MTIMKLAHNMDSEFNVKKYKWRSNLIQFNLKNLNLNSQGRWNIGIDRKIIWSIIYSVYVCHHGFKRFHFFTFSSSFRWFLIIQTKIHYCMYWKKCAKGIFRLFLFLGVHVFWLEILHFSELAEFLHLISSMVNLWNVFKKVSIYKQRFKSTLI